MKKWIFTLTAVLLLSVFCPGKLSAAQRHENITGRERLSDAPLATSEVVYTTKVDQAALTNSSAELYYHIHVPDGSQGTYITYEAEWVPSQTAEGKARISLGTKGNNEAFNISYAGYRGRSGDGASGVGTIGNFGSYQGTYSCQGAFFHFSAGNEIYLRLSEIYGSGSIKFTVTVYSDTANTQKEIGSKERFSLNDTVRGDCPVEMDRAGGDYHYDEDWYLFKTGSNTVYHVFLEGNAFKDSSRPWSVNAEILKKNGDESNRVFFPSSPTGGQTGSTFKPGIHYYIPLEPNTEYLFRVYGRQSKYSFTIGGFSLQDLNKSTSGQTTQIISKIYRPGTQTVQEVYDFNGKAIKPDVMWYVHTRIGSSSAFCAIPKEGVDYRITYQKNNAPGTASITVTGKGNIKGSFRLSFKISGAKKGTTFKAKKISYKVTGNTAGNMTVAYLKPDGSKSSITIPDTVKLNGVTYKVTSIGDKAFKNQKKLTKITIGANVKSIGKEAFSGCTKLTTVKGGKNLTTIGNKAFFNCKAIKTMNLTSTALTKIGSSAFSGCTAMTTFSASSKKLSSIGKEAFYQNKKLSSITLKTTKLTKSKVGANAFKGIKSNCKIKVPSSRVKAYKSLVRAKGAPKNVKVVK